MPVRTGTSSMMLWSELSKIIIVVVFLVKLIDSDFAAIRTEGVDSDVMDVILVFKPKMINDILVYTEYIGIFASALHVNVHTRFLQT